MPAALLVLRVERRGVITYHGPFRTRDDAVHAKLARLVTVPKGTKLAVVPLPFYVPLTMVRPAD